jgi:outer membrane protease
MEDRDWDPALDPDGGMTNFSSSDAYVEGAYMLDFLTGASLPIKSVVVGSAYLGLSYMHFKWAAYNGTYSYPYSPNKSGSFTGLALTYSQDWLLFIMGLSASLYVIPKTVVTLSFQGSPLLRYTGQDDHYLRIGSVDPGQFRDQINFGIYLEPGGKIIFSPNERLSLGLNISWRYIKGNPHGESYGRRTGVDRDGEYVMLGNSAGAAYQALDSSLSATIRF